MKESSEKTPRKTSKKAKTPKKAIKKYFEKKAIPIFITLIVIILILILFSQAFKTQGGEKEVVTVSALQQIINVSKLSTFTAVYNGIAQVMNEEKPEEVDYYVSYEARVKAGIDFKEIEFVVDEENRKVHITLPEIEITDINVDIASMDFIFINDKANMSTVTQQAYSACEADAIAESKGQAEIFELAEQNARNTIKALISPIVEQLDREHNWEIEWEGQ